MMYIRGKDSNGEYGDTVIVSEHIRNKRNELLAACDWTQAADSPLSEEKKTEWATYRQQLRDITQFLTESSTADDIEFPAPPA